MKNYLYLLALSLLFSACEKYKTQFEGPYEDPKDGSSIGGKPINYEVWYALNGQLHAASPDFRHEKTVATSGSVELVAVNYTHDHIAYKATGNNIVIIDSSGTNPVTVPNSTNVKWFDWHSNNQTLYMLKTDNKLYQYGGTPVTLSVTNLASGLPYVGGSDLQIPAAAVLPDGGVIICFSIYTGLGYKRGLYINYPAGSPNVDRFVDMQYSEPRQIRISQNGDHVVFTAYDYSFGSTDSYSYNISSGGMPFNVFPYVIHLAATSPDASGTACWSKGDGTLFELFTSNITLPASGNCTGLDW
ncbi:MAG: hypothetical protein WCR52_10445 [Bacteroidota bacterium]